MQLILVSQSVWQGMLLMAERLTQFLVVTATHLLCKQYGQLQMDFVSVERVVELLSLEQEPPGDISPPASWPTFSGEIVFNNVTIKYAPHLDPALKNISLRIPGGTDVAIVGRTGASRGNAYSPA